NMIKTAKPCFLFLYFLLVIHSSLLYIFLYILLFVVPLYIFLCTSAIPPKTISDKNQMPFSSLPPAKMIAFLSGFSTMHIITFFAYSFNDRIF
ncbi:MAG: hypothetical protein V8R22_00175, partial [Lachnospiraceae bacterium]